MRCSDSCHAIYFQNNYTLSHMYLNLQSVNVKRVERTYFLPMRGGRLTSDDKASALYESGRIHWQPPFNVIGDRLLLGCLYVAPNFQPGAIPSAGIQGLGAPEQRAADDGRSALNVGGVSIVSSLCNNPGADSVQRD